MKFTYILLCLCFAAFTASAQKKYDLVKDFGAVPDDKTDCYAAFQRAAHAVSKAGTGILNIPNGKYYIAPYKISGGKNKNGFDDIRFINCKNLLIEGNGCTIRMNGKFIRTKDYREPNVAADYSYSSTIVPFVITNCSNLLIQNITLDGGVRDMLKEGNADGYCYGIVIEDGGDKKNASNNVTISNVAANYFSADGFYIRSNGENLLMKNCSAKCNATLGLAFSKGRKVVIDHCNFDSTGFTGKYGSHNPQAGIDIENEFGAGDLSNITVKNCNIRANKGFQIVSPLQTDNVRIDSCFIADISYGYGDALNGLGVFSTHTFVTNCIIFATVMIDISDQVYHGPAQQVFKNNIIYSGNCGFHSVDLGRPCVITDNIMIMLPHAQADQYFPLIVNPNCIFSNNLVMMNAGLIERKRDQYASIVKLAKEVNNNFWLMNGYSVSQQARKSFYYLVAFDGAVLGDQFFPSNNKVSSLNIALYKTVDGDKIKKITAFGLFSAYNQTFFDKKYLIQGDQVRKLLK